MEALGPEVSTKQYKKFSTPTVAKFGDQYYLVASDIFNLSDGGVKLTEEDINALPAIICYLGQDFKYSDNEREAYSLLMKIISNINKMQDSTEYQSFPLGEACYSDLQVIIETLVYKRFCSILIPIFVFIV